MRRKTKKDRYIYIYLSFWKNRLRYTYIERYRKREIKRDTEREIEREIFRDRRR